MDLLRTLEKHNLKIERKGSVKSPQIYCVCKTTGRTFAAWKTQEDAVSWATHVLAEEQRKGA
jgi:hypothetical protein